MKEIYKNKNLVFSLVSEECGFVKLKFFREAVMIIGVDKSQRLLIIQQKRIGASQKNYEFPSGGIKEGETVFSAAERELNEETGYEGKLKFLGSIYPLLGIVDLKLNIFMATDLKKVTNKKELEKYEKITHKFLTLGQVKKILLKNKKSIDGYLAIGVSYFFMFNKNL